VNRPIIRVFGVVTLMFALLVVWTSRWTIFEASSLRANAENGRKLIEQELIPRGDIVAADGTVLAHSVRGSGGVYHRRYPQGGLFAHAIGYSYVNLGQTALERFRNDWLSGTHRSNLSSIIDQLGGVKTTGDEVTTTLDPTAQRVALAALGSSAGSVVALDPRTGAVKVFASVPGYDPTALTRKGALARLNRASTSPLFDRAVQAGYPPGSTFKVVTATAAIDSGRFTPSSVVNGDSPKTISGVPLSNDGNASFGDIDLTTALTFSVNTVWAQVAVAVGKATMARYMDRFGFDHTPPLDLPADEMRASGEYAHGRLLSPRSPLVDVGRMGIGQDKLGVTPLQMAMVAAAIANHCTLMVPHITDRVIDRDGRTVYQVPARVFHQVCSPATAQAVTGMMTHVVQEGTGTAAALSGIQVAGKTGTAETPSPGLNQAWFIAFAPVSNPRVAIAVTVERSPGQGGTVAAPIAKSVMESLLHA
jgi:penicillin-binding protein A